MAFHHALLGCLRFVQHFVWSFTYLSVIAYARSLYYFVVHSHCYRAGFVRELSLFEVARL